MDSPTRQQVFEQQAEQCLLAGEQHRQHLLRAALRLTGCPEEAMDLFQQNLLNCHDAIQRRGFAGQGYEGYLLVSLRNLHVAQQQARRRFVPTDFQARQQPDADESEMFAPREQGPAELAIPADTNLAQREQLARQVQLAVRQQLPMRERVMLRLHAEGESGQDIRDLMGLPWSRRYVWTVLDKLKASLRARFTHAWQALLD